MKSRTRFLWAWADCMRLHDSIRRFGSVMPHMRPVSAPGYATHPWVRQSSTTAKRSLAPTFRNIRWTWFLIVCSATLSC